MSGYSITACAHQSDISVVIHCTCKQGQTTDEMEARFDSQTALHIAWQGATRIFVRIRIMEATLQGLMRMLVDDIESGHSVSDVEEPERNHCSRPWSDDEDSELDTSSEAEGGDDADAGDEGPPTPAELRLDLRRGSPEINAARPAEPLPKPRPSSPPEGEPA